MHTVAQKEFKLASSGLKMILLLMAFNAIPPAAIDCVIDQCDKEVCIIETPQGLISIPKKPSHKEGGEIECPAENLSSPQLKK